MIFEFSYPEKVGRDSIEVTCKQDWSALYVTNLVHKFCASGLCPTLIAKPQKAVTQNSSPCAQSRQIADRPDNNECAV
eukprot:6482561-Amphidinium_carterae.1